MHKHLKYLAALISTSLASVTNVSAQPIEVTDETSEDNSIIVMDLNTTLSQHLAAHRSHSSHGSHRSHRSSSGGGTYREPSPSPPPQTSPSTPQYRESDPLGQQPRLPGSYPPPPKSLSEKLKNEELRKNIIMRMQLTLQFEGYYAGPIDGIMGPQTREAVLAYKKAKGIPGDTVLDAETLNALGIVGY